MASWEPLKLIWALGYDSYQAGVFLMSYKGSQDAIIEINGKAIFSYKIIFLINLHTVALYAAEVKDLVL